MPEVSIVISTYNRSGLLRHALRSALGQRGVDFEVVVVDNGSTDATGGLLAGMGHPRLRVLRNEQSLGATGGRNTGLQAATGTWVAIHDDDDLWAPTKLRAQLDAVEASDATWSYTGCVYIDEQGRLLGGVPPLPAERLMEVLPLRYVVPGGISSMMWRRTALDGDGLLDPALLLTADWDLSLRLLRSGPPAAVEQPLVAYRQHGTALSHQAIQRAEEEFARIEHKFADLRSGRSLDPAARHRFIGSQLLRHGDRRGAARAYVHGWREGDTGSLLRLPGVLLPLGTQRHLRRWLLSDREWLASARAWLAQPV